MTSGWENDSEVEAQASVYVILSKSWISVRGSVDEPTSLDRQVCITFVISVKNEIVYGWMYVYLAAHYFQSYLSKCCLHLWF